MVYSLYHPFMVNLGMFYYNTTSMSTVSRHTIFFWPISCTAGLYDFRWIFSASSEVCGIAPCLVDIHPTWQVAHKHGSWFQSEHVVMLCPSSNSFRIPTCYSSGPSGPIAWSRDDWKHSDRYHISCHLPRAKTTLPPPDFWSVDDVRILDLRELILYTT